MEVRCSDKAVYRYETVNMDDGRKVTKIHVSEHDSKTNLVITADFSFPLIDIIGKWTPLSKFNHNLTADWSKGDISSCAISAPIVTFFSGKGQNRGTIAVSEAVNKVEIAAGVHEEEGTIHCKIEIQAGKRISGRYDAEILLDFRDIRYEKAINCVREWWEQDCGYTPADVPEEARMPMLSTWYSFHQEFTDKNLEDECRKIKELGFGAVIVDDGWQTDDTNRGYAFCGDWKPCESKIKNMKHHVAAIHKMGMKYLLWYSVPYLGRKSEQWERFADKLLAYDKEQEAGILDIRYEEVQEYLTDTYINAVTNWDVDGLKLDFIDEFYVREGSEDIYAEMKTSNLQEALNQFLKNLTQKLQNIKPNILIEFRQRYIGPSVRQYGNMLRVVDCPCSGITNHVASIDLRLLSGHTAVHSDMIMWHQQETPVMVAQQIISCLFTTLQFSVKMNNLTKEQRMVTDNYLAFMEKYREILLLSEIRAEEPHNLYPVVRAEDNNIEIIAVYAESRVVPMNLQKTKSIIVNGTVQEDIYITVECEATVRITYIDCMGHEGMKEVKVIQGTQKISCQAGGYVEMEEIK